jgi:hypothetical protein
VEYFNKHKATQIAANMSLEVRGMCGLGFPAKPYTQNANECINSMIKKDLGCKKLSMAEAVDLVGNEGRRKKHDLELALIEKGEYIP